MPDTADPKIIEIANKVLIDKQSALSKFSEIIQNAAMLQGARIIELKDKERQDAR